MKYSRIAGTGSAIGSKLVTNEDIAKLVETDNDWIVERSGIQQRFVLAEGETLTHLSKVAATRAMEMANIHLNQIDLIILATTTPDYSFPSTACLVQRELGISNVPAFDISAACAGFNYGITIADSMIKTGQSKNALVIGADALTRLVDWRDRSTCFLFGDGVGAVIMQGSDEPGLLATEIHAAGEHKDLLYAPAGYGERSEPPYIKMQGNAVYKVAVNTLKNAVIEILNKAGLQESDVDWLVPHQANIRIIHAVAKRLNLPLEKVVINVDRYGNTSSASLPIAMDEAIRDGRIQRGQILLLESFGAGLAWGSALIKF